MVRNPTTPELWRRELGKKLKSAREIKGYDLRRLEAATGINHSTILSYEAGTTAPNLDRLAKVCRALEIPKIELTVHGYTVLINPTPGARVAESARPMQLMLEFSPVTVTIVTGRDTFEIRGVAVRSAA